MLFSLLPLASLALASHGPSRLDAHRRDLAPRAAGKTHTIDDADTSSITYSGDWTHSYDQLGVTLSWSDSPKAAFSFKTPKGAKGVTIHSSLKNDRASFDVYVDGKVVGNGTEFASATTDTKSKGVFSSKIADGAAHTFKVVSTGGAGKYLALDSIKIHGAKGGSSSSGSGSSGSGSSGSSSGSSGSSSSGSGSSGSGVASGGGGAGTVHVTLPTSGFQGPQNGAIMSWFRADSGQDSTNGRSWCGIEYTDDMPLFAPNMKVLSPSLATYSSDPDQWRADGTKWCGLQAKITYKGKSTIGYIGDAFDPTWVRTPTSIDVLYNLFSETYGSSPGDDKDIVGEGVTWELTGYKKTEYAFQG